MPDLTSIERAIDEPKPWVLLEGVKYFAPFLCMCCGCEVEIRQWAFGRACGKCDTGVCQPWDRNHRPDVDAHPEPAWEPHGDGGRYEKMARFNAHANHEFRDAAAAPADGR